MKYRILLILFTLAGICFEPSCATNAHSDYRTIHQLVINGDLGGVTQDLNGYPGDLSLTDDAGQTPLHLAAIHCRTNVLALLLERGAKVDARAKGGATPLHLAAQAGCVDAVIILLQHGADINARDDDGHTPMARAREWKQEAVVNYLGGHGGKE
jgi:ankyrin repeat protein